LFRVSPGEYFHVYRVSLLRRLTLSTSQDLIENQAQAQLCEALKKGKMISRKQRRKNKMKKFGLVLAGGIAAIILLSTLGPMVGLLISLAILYFIYKQFLKAESTGGKIALSVIGVVFLMASISNAPAIIGLLAAYILYLVYKNWNSSKQAGIKDESDPFVNFEKQWNEIKNY
jgi:lia operon protein LiaI